MSIQRQQTSSAYLCEAWCNVTSCLRLSKGGGDAEERRFWRRRALVEKVSALIRHDHILTGRQ